MHVSLLAVFVVLVANQTVETFRVSTSSVADVRQETLQELNPETKQTIEVFPGTYVSPYGAMVMKRIEEMLARIDEADRELLVAGKIGAGFDRSITHWRAHSTGRSVALAVHYHRDRVMNLKIALSDDYGRPEPIVPAEYEFFTIAVCSRAAAGTWSCSEEEIAAAAKRHNLTLPRASKDRDGVVEKLLELVLASR